MSLEPAIQSTERLPRRPVHVCDVELGLVDLPLRDPPANTSALTGLARVEFLPVG